MNLRPGVRGDLLAAVAVVATASAAFAPIALASGSLPYPKPPGALVAPAQTKGKPSNIDVSSDFVFGMRWHRLVVREGLFRKVNRSAGAPVIGKECGCVVVAQGEGDILALRIEDGEQLWRYQGESPFEANLTLASIFPPDAEGNLTRMAREAALVPTQGGELLAVGLEGSRAEIIWRADLGARALGPVRIDGDRFLVTTIDNRVHMRELHSGKAVWAKGRKKGKELSVHGQAQALLHEGVVYATYSDGYAEAYDANSGKNLWSRPLSFGARGRVDDFRDADADPIMIDGSLIVASYSDGVYALDPKDGSTRWQERLLAVAHLARYKDRIIALSANGHAYSLNAKTGAQSGEGGFHTRFPVAAVSRVLVIDHLLVFAAGESGLVVLDARNGRPLQATAVPAAFSGDLAYHDGKLAAFAEDGRVYFFERGAPALVQ